MVQKHFVPLQMGIQGVDGEFSFENGSKLEENVIGLLIK